MHSPCRPARNIDHLDSRVQQRIAMGCRLTSYEAVAYAADRAAAAIKKAVPLAAQLAVMPTVPQQEGAPSQLVCAARMLLRSAAVCPDVAAAQLLQTGTLAELHKASQDACIAQIRRAQRKHSKTDAQQDDTDALIADINKDLTELRAAAVNASQASTAAASTGQEAAAVAAEQVPDSRASQEQPPAEATSAHCDEPAAKKVRLSSGHAAGTPALRAAQSAACNTHLADVQLDAARWLLLSRRAVLSGPPGCDKPPLQLPGMAVKVSSIPRESGGGASKTSTAGNSNVGVGGSKKAFHGFTPKCGKCRTCIHPSMKKACVVNKERLAQGLAPILLPNDD